MKEMACPILLVSLLIFSSHLVQSGFSNTAGVYPIIRAFEGEWIQRFNGPIKKGIAKRISPKGTTVKWVDYGTEGPRRFLDIEVSSDCCGTEIIRKLENNNKPQTLTIGDETFRLRWSQHTLVDDIQVPVLVIDQSIE